MKIESTEVDLAFFSIKPNLLWFIRLSSQWSANLPRLIWLLIWWSLHLLRWICHLSHDHPIYCSESDFCLINAKSTTVYLIFTSWLPNLPLWIWFLADKAGFCLPNATYIATNTSIYKIVGYRDIAVVVFYELTFYKHIVLLVIWKTSNVVQSKVIYLHVWCL